MQTHKTPKLCTYFMHSGEPEYYDWATGWTANIDSVITGRGM